MLSPLAHDDPAGLGAYRLIARLGTGGMGTVYLARSAGGRTVALKTMHTDIASDPASRTRFQLETDAARVIGGHHGAIVVDADPLAATPWLATEYVLGPPLDDAVALAGPLPELSVRALGAALAGALGQLHLSDVVHRDLKPSNVMVTGYGPKIIDFGIARAAGDDRLTRTGSAAGTPVATWQTLSCRRLSDGGKVWATGIKSVPLPSLRPQLLGVHACDVSGKDPKSFDAVVLHKDTGKQAWTHAQHSAKSLKLTSDGKRLFLLRNETVTAVSGGVA
ncbi:protein kinase domain-containing protein [Streptomyces sp. NBC_00467]|uniref:protein kinase domain-containing protein n=1 Tax=Streptomyces sp. NBC_00467 TaxID=2975752 RepID=UPI002E177253